MKTPAPLEFAKKHLSDEGYAPASYIRLQCGTVITPYPTSGESWLQKAPREYTDIHVDFDCLDEVITGIKRTPERDRYNLPKDLRSLRNNELRLFTTEKMFWEPDDTPPPMAVYAAQTTPGNLSIILLFGDYETGNVTDMKAIETSNYTLEWMTPPSQLFKSETEL